jgi:hypothetical protein
LKEGFKPQHSETYLLSLAEQVELDKFLEENMQKDIYISIKMAPFFFVDVNYNQSKTTDASISGLRKMHIHYH